MKQHDQLKNFHDCDGEKPFRCLCGSLLARLVPEGVEIKCRKCKRQIVLPVLEKDGAAKSGMMMK